LFPESYFRGKERKGGERGEKVLTFLCYVYVVAGRKKKGVTKNGKKGGGGEANRPTFDQHLWGGGGGGGERGGNPIFCIQSIFQKRKGARGKRKE